MIQISLWVTGKTNFDFIKEGIVLYQKRLKHYCHFSIMELQESRGQDSKEVYKKMEGDILLSKLKPGDILVLLDEKGKNLDSIQFAAFIEQQMVHANKQLIFIIGGAYGFSSKVYERANYSVSLSPMTFSHQIVRLLFMEQLYRAMTIIKGEPYHNV